MDLYRYIDVNILALIMMSSVFFIAYFRLDKKDTINVLFFLISFLIIMELIIESSTIVINGRPEAWARPLSVFLHNLLFIIGPGVSFLWCVFVLKWIESDSKSSCGEVCKYWLYMPYIAIVLIVLVGNFFDGVFLIDEFNQYSRGDLFIVTALCAYYYLGFSIFIIYRNRREMLREIYLSFIGFSIIPALGGLIQSLFYGVIMLWSCMAIAFSIVYILIQQRMMQFDALTGVWTKSTFENYMERRAHKEKHDNEFGVIFIDLDGFKQINDTYGHFEGDLALKKAVKILRSSLRETDIIARFGGDEFVILVNKVTPKTLEDIVLRMEEGFKKANNLTQKGYTLSYSIGYDIFNHNKYDIRQFLTHVDYLMYANKEKKKQAI